jgi:four helix bundle protein
MTPYELSERLMQFALRVIRMVEALPRTAAGRTISDQLVRSACSAAANYRAAQRGKSRADFSNKIAIVLEEADEAAFWIELAERAGLVAAPRVLPLRQEAIELVKIFAKIRRTARKLN